MKKNVWLSRRRLRKHKEKQETINRLTELAKKKYGK